MVPIGKYYLGATLEAPLSPSSFDRGGGRESEAPPPSDQEDEEDPSATLAQKSAESRKRTGTMRKDFKFPSLPPRDSGLPDIELPEEDKDGVPGTPGTSKTAPAPSAQEPPMFVVNAAKDSMNPLRHLIAPSQSADREDPLSASSSRS